MPEKAHNHSVMHHAGVEDVTLVLQAQSCKADCAKVEGLNVLGRFVSQVTAVQTGAVGLNAIPKFLAPHLESAWSLDSGPPSFPSACTASYSILRI
jgi:hypothetical protein